MYKEVKPYSGRFKRRGEWAELLFMARAAEHGLRVIKPYGESGRYDCVVESGGRFLRVQVKATTCRRRQHYVCFLENRKPRRYTAEFIDFFAIYVIPVDRWYIIPVEAVSASGRAIILAPHNSLTKNAKYDEAWQLLGGE